MDGINTFKKKHYLPSSNSIIARLLMASFILLPLFCGLLGFSLDKAFSDSLKSNEKAQLLLQAYALIASAELNNKQLWLPEQLTEDKLNQVSSGLFALVFSDKQNKVIWTSPSALNSSIAQNWSPEILASGEQFFSEIDHKGEKLFSLQYSVTWETADQENLRFQFGIFNSQKMFREQIYIYQKTLWGWLGTIAFSLIVIQVLILKWGLKPIRLVAEDILSIQSGQSSQLSGQYPRELSKMTNSINTLLATEAEQRARYKDTLSNLAHSLKTPLAIMQGSLYELSHNHCEGNASIDKDRSSTEKELTEQINQIDQIINYQLKRSVVAPKNPFSNTVNIRNLCDKVISALNKVYRDNKTVTDISIEADIFFKGDEDDLLEVLGNLLDNAFKYGKGHIRIQAKKIGANSVQICIEDNGSGVSEALKNKVLQRGERADTSQPGHGIGLASVANIVSHYGGSIKLEESSLGGLAVLVEL
tara:strand:- start:55409 stop:56833 length:1425 start_codon:yes stop_codon:yes gene_type:complete